MFRIGLINRILNFLLFSFAVFILSITIFFLLACTFYGAPAVFPKNSSAAAVSPDSAIYKLNGSTASITGKTFFASGQNQSAITVSNSGSLALTNCRIITSGNTSSGDKSSFYGLNAGALAASKGKITISNCSIKTTGTGANGVFAYGSGSSVTLYKDTIICEGNLGHGVDATFGGSIILTDAVIKTGPGSNSAALATDRGGGSINADRCKIMSTGKDAPGIYSTGRIDVANSVVTSSGSEAAVIEGSNFISLMNTSLSTAAEKMDDKWGILIYQSFSGDAEGQNGNFSMTGGELNYTASSGPLFFVTNTRANINLKEISIASIASGILIKASVYKRWSSATGGTVLLNADAQVLNGDIIADSCSSVNIVLQNGSSLKGAVNNSKTARIAAVTLDSSSKWILTADSYVTSLLGVSIDQGDLIGNITGNSFNVYYRSSDPANKEFGGKAYSLVNGGRLIPN